MEWVDIIHNINRFKDVKENIYMIRREMKYIKKSNSSLEIKRIISAMKTTVYDIERILDTA